MPDRVLTIRSQLGEFARSTTFPFCELPFGMSRYPARDGHLATKHTLLRRYLITHVIQANIFTCCRIRNKAHRKQYLNHDHLQV